MDIWRPAHRSEVRNLTDVRAVRIHREHIGDEAVGLEATPDDALSIRREERTAVVAGDIGQPLLPAAVRAHDVNLGEVTRVDLELLLLLGAERPVVRITHRGE